MADTAQPTAAELQAALPKSKLPLILAFVGVGGAAAGGGLFFASKGSHAPAPGGEAKHAAAADHEEAASDEAEAEDAGDDGGSDTGPIGTVAKLDPFIVNLLSEDGEMHYLKFNLAVELANEGAVPELEKRSARIRHRVLLALSGLKVADALGLENKKKIQAELQKNIVAAAGRKVARKVYITEYVVQ